ncbi:MAG TPA: hypothetical protein VFR32_04395 [Gaiellaceae bacterium]|nr:hypothetical protein [Gaiellaceae bacterium]
MIALGSALALVIAVDQGVKALVLAGAREGRSFLAAGTVRVRIVSATVPF